MIHKRIGKLYERGDNLLDEGDREETITVRTVQLGAWISEFMLSNLVPILDESLDSKLEFPMFKRIQLG